MVEQASGLVEDRSPAGGDKLSMRDMKVLFAWWSVGQALPVMMMASLFRNALPERLRRKEFTACGLAREAPQFYTSNCGACARWN